MDVTVSSVAAIRGSIRVPGDKSIAHRALILGAMAEGEQIVTGLPDSADVASTVACLRALGCTIEKQPDDSVRISGGLRISGEDIKAAGSPAGEIALDAGNSGTTARLLAGTIAGLGLDCLIDGDVSLRSRPMARIAEPLGLMGAEIRTSVGGCLPMRIRGGGLKAVTFRLPVASAQVKSCVLLAGLNASDSTTVIEKTLTRDHTEILLQAMGVPVDRKTGAVTVPGGVRPRAITVNVPGDISSAAFFAAAAALLPGSEVRLAGTGVNPTRTGALEVMQRMGASITFENCATRSGEPVADIVVRSGSLCGVDIDGPMIPALIDELPLLAVLATQAEGAFTVSGAEELRHKESDRIAAIVSNLSRLGARIEEHSDGFTVHGPAPLQGTRVRSFGDHRIAMAMAVAGLVASDETIIDDAGAVAVSYPHFFQDMDALTA